MASNDSQVLRSTTFSWVEDRGRLLCQAGHTSPINWGEHRNDRRGKQLAQPRTTMENGGEETLQAVANQVVSKERQAYFRVVSIVWLMCDQILVYDAVESINVHMKKALTKLLADPLTANCKNVDNLITSLLKSLIFRAVNKVINTPKVLGCKTEAVLDNLGFVAPMNVIVNTRQCRFIKGKAKIHSRYQNIYRD